MSVYDVKFFFLYIVIEGERILLRFSQCQTDKLTKKKTYSEKVKK